MQTLGQFFLALVPCLSILVLGIPVAILVRWLSKRHTPRREDDLEGLFLYGIPPAHHEPLDDYADIIALLGDDDGK